MASKIILIIKGTDVTEQRLPKPQAPRSYRTWVSAARQTASWQKSAYFALFISGAWHVHPTVALDDTPLKTFPPDAPRTAVEMYLITKSGRRV